MNSDASYILQATYTSLIQDIGKLIQRKLVMVPQGKPKAKKEEALATYTNTFLKDELGLNLDELDLLTSSQNSKSMLLSETVTQATKIAAGIDFERALHIEDVENDSFTQIRLASIFEEVDFGRKREAAYLQLSSLQDLDYPKPAREHQTPDLKQAAAEYKTLLDTFAHEVRNDTSSLYRKIDRQSVSRMYGLLYQYTTSVPASSYEGKKPFVSLFDQSKLRAAVASCLALGTGNQFNMLEFDVSGIQKFIFRITEGRETKSGIAKSLRGRSLFVSLLTDGITMSFLHEFGLTQNSIIFNTGGGALLLLPDVPDYEERVSKVGNQLIENLYEQFHTDLTFVWASVLCNEEELYRFKTDKAIELKGRLEQAKSRKYLPLLDSAFLSADSSGFFYQPAQNQAVCELCGNEIENEGVCPVCEVLIRCSDFLTKKKDLVLLFQFGQPLDFFREQAVEIRLGDCYIYLSTKEAVLQLEGSGKLDLNRVFALESVNHAWMGLTRYLATEVPLDSEGRILDMEAICELAPQEKWGDPKLGILKMDVDNLGTIFAYGLPADTRSLSKFLTLSRMMEVFFGKHLPEICRKVSAEINPEIGLVTKNKTLFYINYAGGDDLVILGPAAGILKLASAINTNLNAYTHNENITISGGIYIQRATQPIRFGVLEAESMLSAAKDREGKNAVSLLNTTLGFREYDQVLKATADFKKNIEEGHYSRTSFYALMKLLDVETIDEFERRIPLALYSVFRNSKNEDFSRKIKARINDIYPLKEAQQSKGQDKAIERLRQLILEMKLTIMQTRS